MGELIRKLFTGSPEAVSDGLRRFTISETTEDRDGTIISADGIDVSNYLKNPVVLWAHDSGLPPIGTAKRVFLDADKLKSDDLFSPADLDHPLGMGFGHTVERMLDLGILRAVSIGFMIRDYTVTNRGGWMPLDIKTSELVEHSVVPVPAHPAALMDADSKGLDISQMMTWAEKVLDNECKLFVPRLMVESFRKTADKKNKTYSIPKVEDMTKEDVEQAIKAAVEPVQKALADATEKIKSLENTLIEAEAKAEILLEKEELNSFIKETIKSAMPTGDQ